MKTPEAESFDMRIVEAKKSLGLIKDSVSSCNVQSLPITISMFKRNVCDLNILLEEMDSAESRVRETKMDTLDERFNKTIRKLKVCMW